MGGRILSSIRKESGLTLLEVLVVLAVLGIISAVVVPAIAQSIRRAQIYSFTRNAQALFSRARLEAIRKGRAAHLILSRNGSLEEFRLLLDEDQDGVGEELLTVEPIGGQVDVLAPAGEQLVEGFATSGDYPAGQWEATAIFRADGSVASVGAMRFGDPDGNLFEIRVGPAPAVARTFLRKWSHQAGAWQEQHEKPGWVWH